MAAAPPSLIIVGGGLAGGLCALALAHWRPEVQVTLIEPGKRIGGNHLWSFFDSDLDDSGRTLIVDLIGHRWSGYDVRFPAYDRALGQAYNSIESEGLDRAVRGALPSSQIIHEEASAVDAASVTLTDGRQISADAVLDARGFGGTPRGLSLAWQKFVGQLLRVDAGHGLSRPVVMDAAVDQTDGYRFVYLLPFDDTHLFVEDTYYTSGPDLDRATLRQCIRAYAGEREWTVDAIEREEQGVLPVVLGGDFELFWPPWDAVARAGVRGGFFHPLTSYSLPQAVAFACWLARTAPLDQRLAGATRERAAKHWRASGYDRLLSRMLMNAAEPSERYRVLQRFYRLPEPLIARFYAGRSSTGDRVRILAGRPPVSIRRALGVLLESK